jgi:hypothetical protein
MSWNDPNVTEQQLILESPIVHPGDNGGLKTLSLQRAGYLKRLRMYHTLVWVQASGTGAPAKSAWGPFASSIKKIRVEANGKVPLYSMSGLGAQIYNEVENRDGSMLAPPAYEALNNVTAAATLSSYSTPATGAVTYTVKFAIEFLMSLPVFVKGLATELGLWLLQEQSVDVGIELDHNKPYVAAAAVDSPYSGGTAVVGTTTLATSFTAVERELYGVPGNKEDRPDESFAHQVIEYEQAILGKFARFDIPSSGLVLRAVAIFLDSANAFVEWTDIDNVAVVYGSNITPILRPGWSMIQEYLQDYNRYPPKGVIVLDFYKWGLETVRLVKNSEALANFRLEFRFLTTASGTVKVLLDTLVPVLRQAR